MVKYLPDYYKILKIDTNSDKQTIKKSYENLSKKYTSETNKQNKTKMYDLITDAYTVLSNDKKRKKYDKLRKTAIQNKKRNNKKKNDNTKEIIDVAGNVKDMYDLTSKLFKLGSSTMKGKSLFTGTNLIIGSAMVGYGVKKGREYMAKRGKENKK